MDKKTVGYISLIKKIIEERITGLPCESKSFQGNKFTDRGHDLEAIARIDYEFRNLVLINQIGVIELDDWVLCSPDGLINEDGLYQAKCPIFNTQLEYLKTRKIPGNYYKQMQFELFVSNREYNIFNSFHPSLPAVDITVRRDDATIYQIEKRIQEAKDEVLYEIEFINTLKIQS
jgi:hypothetical protein